MFTFRLSKFYRTAVIVIIMSLIMGSASFILYSGISKIIVDGLGKHALSSATTIAAFLEKDIDDYEKLTNRVLFGEDCSNDPYYQEMLLLFQKIKKNNASFLIYTEAINSENRTVYILDAEAPDSDSFSPIGSTDYVTDTEINVLKKGKPTATGIVYATGWGNYITGFAPIENSQTGKKVGLVGVDVPADYAMQIMKRMAFCFLIGSILIIALSIAPIYRMYISRSNALNKDFLTGAYSKRFFESSLNSMIKNAEQNGTTFVLGVIDLDNFKEINDKYGHSTGDTALKSITKVIQSSLRKGDVCSRFGGDEFAILLPDADFAAGELICERIMENLSEHEVVVDEFEKIGITLSIGLAEWDQDSKQSLKEKADRAMYCAKNSGKNRIHYCRS